MSRRNWRDTRFVCEMFYVIDDEESKNKTILDEPKARVVDTFKASSYDEAIEYARKYREKHSGDNCSYFWRQRHSHDLGDFGLWHCDGICSWGASDVD